MTAENKNGSGNGPDGSGNEIDPLDHLGDVTPQKGISPEDVASILGAPTEEEILADLEREMREVTQRGIEEIIEGRELPSTDVPEERKGCREFLRDLKFW